MLVLVLLILAAVCFALAALNVASTRVSLLALGLFVWVLTDLIPKL